MVPFISCEALEETQECEKIYEHADRCAFVRENCADLQSSLLNYLDFYYCGFKPAFGFAAFFLLATWLLFLFAFVGTAASDYFCPNLSSIATTLNLSENLAGVTFLAFGNGAPDVFTTFSALKANSSGLAFGELIGAAAFISSVVVGSMAIVKPFRVSSSAFLRDILFFTGAIIAILACLWDGKVTLFESVGLIIYYAVYVSVVVWKNWVEVRGEQHKTLVQQARAEYAQWDDEPFFLLENNNEGPVGRSSGSHEEEPLLADEQDEDHNIPFLGQSAPPIRRRKSLLSAIEFRDVVQNLHPYNSSSSFSLTRTNSVFSRRSTSNPQTRSHSGEEAPVVPSHGLSIIITSDTDGADTTTVTNSPLPLSPLPSPNSGETRVRRVSFGDPDLYQPSDVQALIVSPTESSTSTPLLSPTITYTNSKVVQSAKNVTRVLFPGIQQWKQKSGFGQAAGLITLPIQFLLKCTVPVAEEVYQTEVDVSPVTEDGETINESVYLEEIKTNTWVKWLTVLQFFTVLPADDTPAFRFAWIPPIVGSVFAGCCFLLTKSYEIPTHYHLVSYVGFLSALAWIYLIANEVVGLLQALGLILGLSESIIGLTIFAMGNSLGDFVANVTMAKMGFPMMAVSACYGGPMLNILIGIGASATYIIASTGEDYPINPSITVFVCGCGLLATLLTALLYLPRNGYHFTRQYGYCLVAIYLTCMCINVALEIAG
ncbi:hypothetical protein K493DRAFT_351588 [Basidiobolus meristosporus CBS 931.73]|uniref:Sodium/calcium exchanger membrane region domain-containing protein n=1 Tax=Basidiobolus meristosporus CBS 931.73 TaxID=1314790 RepID=A0A1Y1YBS7_9FUNG|nr:hypothetical protein K493DRAFT_351588 [Basidiobolus meristosporus CBS 931.73]|eukprot:ORX95438.1 hypothetical protein K493DRAFT_351588 [Basidiobolus meristosporus CBS 931.73]